MTNLLWMTLPYIAFTSFVLGHIWRYRTDQFGWTTRSSQIYESRLLRLGSPLFHFGILGVLGGHVVGLLIPESWTSAIGISEHTYHLMAIGMGAPAGFAVIAGAAILLYRRITVHAVRGATTDQKVKVWSRPTGSRARGIAGSAAKMAFTSLAKRIRPPCSVTWRGRTPRRSRASTRAPRALSQSPMANWPLSSSTKSSPRSS